MAEVVLLDTGPLVALMDPREAHHAWAKAAFARLRLPLATCQAVITETCFLLSEQPRPLAAFRRHVQAGHFVDALNFARLAPRVMELMERYANVPMSFADACLVALAESTPGARLFTLDRDFLITGNRMTNRCHCWHPLPGNADAAVSCGSAIIVWRHYGWLAR